MASGVSEGIQKLGRLWLELAAVAALDNSPGLLCVPSFSLPMFLPEKKKKAVLTDCIVFIIKNVLKRVWVH